MTEESKRSVFKRKLFQTGLPKRPTEEAMKFCNTLAPGNIVSITEQITSNHHWIVVYYWDIPLEERNGNP